MRYNKWHNDFRLIAYCVYLKRQIGNSLSYQGIREYGTSLTNKILFINFIEIQHIIN